MVREWNAIATDTIKTSLGPRPSGQAAIWEGFVSVAVYNAVVGIEGGYALYKWRERGPAKASSAAAAATAAHDVLLTCFPAFKERLDTAYANSLAALPAGQARDRGVDYGRRAAARIIELREGDGRFADVPFTASPAPGAGGPPRPRSSPSSTPGSPGSALSCSPPRSSSAPADHPPSPRPLTPKTSRS
ncbi:hypothetical protein ABZ656_46235 [Streptomyces sp. NPDC007095]|uniref:hypothetical protein n=1 Tax=Streptomyces sp. NPDC007095 TaxID=3154482 RepID=UPI0033D979B7